MGTREFYLMRKNEIITLAAFDGEGKMLSYAPISSDRAKQIAPMYYSAHPEKYLIKWWESRSIPLTRDQIQKFLSDTGYTRPTEYLIKNLGLSLTDYYWLKEPNSELRWEDVNLFDNPFHENILLSNQKQSGKIPSYSPNSSLQGNIEKTWSIVDGKRSMIKGNHGNLSSESINEVIATKIHELQGYDNYTEYSLIKIKGKSYEFGCISKAFTSQEMELVSAYAVCTSQLKPNNVSYYEHFIEVSGKHGIDKKKLRQDLEYQILVDFVMSGYDRHLTNIAILRDADTLEFKRMAPIYDSGGSMFAERTIPKTYKELYKMPITSFASHEKGLLKHITMPDLLNLDKLPSEDDIRQMYKKEPKLSDTYIDQIAHWYSNKIEMCHELQKGIDPFRWRAREVVKTEANGGDSHAVI